MTTIELDSTTPTRHRARLSNPAHTRRTARLDRVLRGVAHGSLTAGLGLVTWWWAAGDGLSSMTTVAGALTSLGKLTGLWASLLLLVQVLMMARIPMLERAFGQDRLARGHRLVGFTSFSLMLAHLGLISWGYAGGNLARTPATAWNLTLTYPGMLLAAVGTACLIAVVLTSIRAARSRLRYESWHLIHLYAYAGAGLALPHQLWTGSDFIGSTGRTVFWWGLWATALMAVLVFRLALPALRTLRHDLRVERVVRESPDTVSVWIRGRGLHRLGAQAGQFFTWRFLGRDGATRGNPYSLSAAPTRDRLRITVKDLGDNSRSLAELRPGQRVAIEGPFGRLTARAREQRRVLLIGSGVGITPLRALAEGLDYRPGEATLLYRFTGEPLFADEWHDLTQRRGLNVLYLPGRRRGRGSWLGEGMGSSSDLACLKHWVPLVTSHDVYVCGPEQWTESVLDTLASCGVPESQVHVEHFGW